MNTQLFQLLLILYLFEFGSSTLTIKKQGIFSVGGSVLYSEGTFDVANYYTSRDGSSLHVDHSNVLYQIPEDDNHLPLIFLHGYGQSRMGWMTTPDGREGWSDFFLKKGHSVFLIDQPRRGEAGQTSYAGTISNQTSDQTWYTQFRIGTYINNEFTYNNQSQFPRGADNLDQFFRQMTPDTGMDSQNGDQNINVTLVANSVAQVIDKVYSLTGKKSILMTHSQGGMPGWETALYTDNIASIIAIEPGMGPTVDSDVYNALVQKKFLLLFIMEIISELVTNIHQSQLLQCGTRQSAYTFAERYKNEGLTCNVFDLPNEGIYGNDHMMFQDLNSDVIAQHIENWILNNVEDDENMQNFHSNSRLIRLTISNFLFLFLFS